MNIKKERMKFLLENCIDYIQQIHSDDNEYLERFYKEVIGMTDSEMQFYNVLRCDING